MPRSLRLLLVLFCGAALHAQQPSPVASNDPLAPLDFLIGTWSAKTDTAASSAGAQGSGTYTFHRDLNGHTLVRSASYDDCKAPTTFNCGHRDQLTIFADPNAMAMHKASLLAIYLDTEGHVIYYTISLPDAHTAIFNSQGLPSLPKYRLIYHLESDGPKVIMNGKFQTASPGSDDFHSYLEWSGQKR